MKRLAQAMNTGLQILISGVLALYVRRVRHEGRLPEDPVVVYVSNHRNGAAAAREMGLPAVMFVRNALQIFRNGDRVRINGQKGEVLRL